MLRIMKPTTLLLALVCLLSVVGVGATWKYAEGPARSVSVEFADVVVNEFHYKAEEILPGEENNEDKKNHYDLVYRLLYDEGYGLNPKNAKDVILDSFGKHPVLHCEVNSTKGGNLWKLFMEDNPCENIRFIIMEHEGKEDELVVYSYDKDPVDNEIYGVTEIVVYKTILRYGEHYNEDEGKTLTEWYADEAHPGYAPVIYKNSDKVGRTVDYTKWYHM